MPIQARDQSVCVLYLTHIGPHERYERRAAPIIVAPRKPKGLVLVHSADDRHELGALRVELGEQLLRLLDVAARLRLQGGACCLN